jgi:hypothetical protein
LRPKSFFILPGEDTEFMFINPADATHGQREIREARYITIEFDKKQKQSIQEPI